MGRSIFVCEENNCSAVFRRSDRFLAHKRNVHLDERPFVCAFEGCFKAYCTPFHLKRHENIHKKSFHKCSYNGCSVILKTQATLKKHIDDIHLKKTNKLYKCSLCNEEFNKHNWLQRHLFRHTGDYPYKCSIENCGKCFLLPSRLRTHMKIHEGYKCDYLECEQIFNKWSLLVSHKKEFHPTLHSCKVCDRVFSRSNNLKKHSEVHNNPVDRPVYPCLHSNCPRFYFAERNLTFHIKTFHEARPHLCERPFCGRAFKTQEDLTRHLLCHDGKKKQRKFRKPKPPLAVILSGYNEDEKTDKIEPIV